VELSGKVAIITGAGKGIGRATAIEMASRGAHLVLADISETALEDARRELEQLAPAVLAIRMDVARRENADQMVARAVASFGHVDILVNNAGIASAGKASWRMSALDLEDAEWDRVLAVNLKGQFNCARAVMPVMMKQRSGAIVNLSSTTALTGAVGSAPYCASKAGVMALTKVLARELGPYNVRVNAIAPGLTLTSMQDGTPPEVIAMATRSIALGRAGGPHDIAKAIVMLSAESLFVTGQTLVVDGGSTMH
jgi:3-oxoacyl-[acyl-carrier protein] reductase